MHQVTKTLKRKKLSGDLWIYRADEEKPLRSYDRYLSNLHTYLLAMAIAGSGKAPGTPGEQEVFGSESTQYVSAPWDVLEAYYWRAVRVGQTMPEGSRLDWLERVDVAERAVWVSTFRDSTATIGAVVQETMAKRDAHWEVSPVTTRAMVLYDPSGPNKGGNYTPRSGRNPPGRNPQGARSYDRYLSNLHTYLLAPLHYRGDEEPRGGGRAVCKDAL